MIYLFILFTFFCVTDQWICDFDYGKECIRGLPSTSFALLNQTTQQIRQPISDVTAILTSNDKGECFFPYQLGSFEMYFCEKHDPILPSTCPILNGNGSKMNCSEGEYGYEIFHAEESGSRSYQLESLLNLSIGDHCIQLFYYLSDGNSNGTIQVIIEDSQTNQNHTILLTSLYQANKWHQIRQNFRTLHSISKIFFIFERGSSNSNSFYIGIDQITILDMFCEPMTTLTTEKSFRTTMTSSIPTTTSVIPTMASSIPTTTSVIPTTNSSISTMTSSIPTTTSSISTTTSSISTMTSSISTTTSSISTKTSSIPTTTSSISTKTSSKSTKTSSISTMTSSISTTTSSISTKTSSISTKTSSISTMTSSISTKTTDSTVTDKNSIILTSISSTLPTSTVNSVTTIYSSNSTTNVLYTISSTLSMNNTIRVITKNSTMIPINSGMIILTWNSSSSKIRLSYRIEFSIILILFLLKY